MIDELNELLIDYIINVSVSIDPGINVNQTSIDV